MKYLSILLFIFSFSQIYGQVDTIYWQEKSPLPSNPRFQFGHFLIDSGFYIVGGIDSNSTFLKEVWEYNIITNQWLQLGDFPGGPISSEGTMTMNGKGYLLSERDSIANYHCDSALWEYDPALDSWTREANFPGPTSEGFSAFAYNDTGYVGFGYGCSANYFSDLWQYDPIANHWTQIIATSMPVGRASAAALPAGKAAYIVDGAYTSSFKDIWKYDLTSHQWDSLGVMPGLGRSYPPFWSFDSILLGGAGEVEDSAGNIYLGNDYYRYDIAHNIWTPVVFLGFLDSVADGAAFVVGNTGYFFGGLRTSQVNPFPIYNYMWSFDATSILPHDSTTVGIRNTSSDGYNFKLYPNPVHADQNFQLTTSGTGQISFYTSLGQILFSSNLNAGMNKFNAAQLNDAADVVFYRATMKNGSVENGRIVVIR